MTVMDLEDIMKDKKGIVFRYGGDDGSSVTVVLHNPGYTFNSPTEGTKPFVKVLEKPMKKALDLLMEMNEK